MSLRPVDIVKTQEVTQIKHVENQRSEQEQSHLLSQFQHHVKDANETTVKTFHSENKENRYDAKEKSKNSNSGSKQSKKRKEENEKASKEPVKPGGFDVLI